MPISIAIDGPAGAGKSTIAKRLAEQLSYVYVDTGALYRAVGYYVSQQNIDPKDAQKTSEILKDIVVELRFIDGEQRVFLNNEDVSSLIRTAKMGMYASAVSAHDEVRKFLFNQQRNLAKTTNLIMDGRDIGTVVLPDATVKIFLTATTDQRAKRRYDELVANGQKIDFNQLLDEIKTRDYNDSNRKNAPLKQAEDAILVDTTKMDIPQVLAHITDIINTKIN